MYMPSKLFILFSFDVQLYFVFYFGVTPCFTKHSVSRKTWNGIVFTRQKRENTAWIVHLKYQKTRGFLEALWSYQDSCLALCSKHTTMAIRFPFQSDFILSKGSIFKERWSIYRTKLKRLQIWNLEFMIKLFVAAFSVYFYFPNAL